MNPFWDNIDIFFFLSLSTYTISLKKKKKQPPTHQVLLQEWVFTLQIRVVSGFVGVRSLGASLYSVAMVFYGCLFNERAACNVGLSGSFFFLLCVGPFFLRHVSPPPVFKYSTWLLYPLYQCVCVGGGG